MWRQRLAGLCEPAEYRRTASTFLRLLAAVYAIAILSLWVQIDGLIGHQGILPIASWLDAVRQHPELNSFSQSPTLCWLSASDTFLHVQCAAGIGLAVMGMLGIAPPFTFLGLWLIYLSLAIASQTFLGFQWDNLLLEAGFLAISLCPPTRIKQKRTESDLSHAKTQSRQEDMKDFSAFAPLRLCVRHSLSRPSRFGIFALRLLLFKLMFGSGLVKIASGDSSWWPDLNALTYHYETTCLPLWPGWYVLKLPLWFHKLSCLLMLFLEFGVPILFFTTRRLRLVACVLEVFLQLVIATTGNYAFFNMLTIVLCVPLLDDSTWPISALHRSAATNDSGCSGASVKRRLFSCPIYILYTLLSILILAGQCDRVLSRYGHRFSIPWPRAIGSLYEAISPFRTVNSYGLFANMTKSRAEIIVEGSDDGIEWKAYEFKWKPGDVTRRPSLVAPHQPRLDWQMWFAALTSCRNTHWFTPFMVRLLEGSPPVLALLQTNPFPNHPPRYVRALIYDYHFSDAATRRETGAWWTRTPLGLYCPAISLKP